MTRIFFGALVALACGLVTAAGPDAYPQISRNSAFIRHLLEQPLGANRRDARIAALVLYRTGNVRDGEALDRVEKRRLLARFLGEPFEFAGTRAQAIEAERAAAPLKQVIARALGSVTVDYAPPGTIPRPPTPDARLLGNDLWATGPTNTAIAMPMVIRHTLHVPATAVGIQVGSRSARGPASYYLFLTCKPAGNDTFAPGVSQPALCTGSESREGVDRAIQALLERRIPAPLPAYSFMTREADLYGDYLRFNDEEESAVRAAAAMVASASCEDLGNCAEAARARAHARWQTARPGVLLALTVAVLLLAVYAAGRVPPRDNTGWFVTSLATLVIVVSVLAIVAMFRVTAPDPGLEAIAYSAFLIFGLLPHVACVGIVAASLAGGRATRLRVFAVTLGLLTPLLVWASLIAYAS